MKKIIILASLCAACSALKSNSSEWQELVIPINQQQWRWCSEFLDGPGYADKGWCWVGKECRNRFLRKDECRSKPYFCSFSDVACMEKNGFKNKKVMDKDAILYLQ